MRNLFNSAGLLARTAAFFVGGLLVTPLPADTTFIEKAGPPQVSAGGVLFTFEAPAAHAVSLAGQFNGWSHGVDDPNAAMQKSAPNGIWYKVVEIPDGHTEYKFVVIDKEGGIDWRPDPFSSATGENGNSIYDPNNTTVSRTLLTTDAFRVSMNDAKQQLMVGFLREDGGVRHTLSLPPIMMDGIEQVGFAEGAEGETRIANESMWVEIASAGDRSVALTYGALDKGLHDWELRVPGNDAYYGGGERFHSINQKGHILAMRSMDHPGEKGAVSYKPVPFIMSLAGFGMWIDSWTPGYFDLNATARSTCSFSYREDQLRVVFIAGPSFADILKEYTALTGRSPIPPIWSFAPWKSRNVHKNREEVLEDVEKYREHDLPASVLVIDSPWERGYNDFILNDEQFTDPKGMFERIQQLGFHTCLWLTPFVNSKNVQDMKGITRGPSSNFQEAVDNGFLIKDSKGEVMLTEWWKGTGGLVDFTNPDATEWWLNQLDKAQEWGVKAWKCDDGEGTFVLDAVTHDGSSPDEMKGRYGYLYLETMQRHIDERLGGDGVLFARPGFAGSQKFPYCWAGDNHAGWDFENGLPGVIRAGQTAALSGIALWGHDIAGYHGEQTPELFNRWTQFGAFSPLMQLHMTSNKGPWDFGQESLDIYRQYAKLHMQLFPYRHAATREASETGMPIIRPMVLAYQNDPIARREDFQYMFGPDILVAPMYQPGTHRSLYLPANQKWVDWWSGEVLDGGKYIETHAPMNQIPLYVKVGAVIPMIPDDIDTLVPRSHLMEKGVVTLDARRILQVWPGSDCNGSAIDINVQTVATAEGGVKLTVTSERTLPLQVHLKHQKLTGEVESGMRITWNEQAKATVISWPSFPGKGELELKPE